MTKTLKNVLRGAGQLFDLAGVTEARAHRAIKVGADKRTGMSVRDALRSDAERLGRDMKRAMDNYRPSRG